MLSAPPDQKSWGKNLSSQEPKFLSEWQKANGIVSGQDIQSQSYGEKTFPFVLLTVHDYGEKRVLSGAGWENAPQVATSA